MVAQILPFPGVSLPPLPPVDMEAKRLTMVSILECRMAEALIRVNLGRSLRGEPIMEALPQEAVNVLARQLHDEELASDHEYRRGVCERVANNQKQKERTQ